MALLQLGIQGYQQGAIFDQTLLLQDIRDGLTVYNTGVDPMIELFTEQTIRQTLRVSQAPKVFGRSADGGNPESSRMLYRLLNVPLNDYDLNSEFTVKWLQDALPSDIIAEVNGAFAGDVELVNALFWSAVFTKQTAGSVGTAYQAGFYNGETDVPPYKNNTFGSAHYHYLGSNTSVYDLATHRAMKQDITEHGYGQGDGMIHGFYNSAQMADVLALFNSNSSILQAPTPERQTAIDAGAWGTNLKLEGVYLHFDDNIPAGYCAMMATDVKPLSKREHFKPEYQGLQMFQATVNEAYPLAGMTFLRRIGFAVQHLGAGTCRQITGSTSYSNPTFRLG